MTTTTLAPLLRPCWRGETAAVFSAVRAEQFRAAGIAPETAGPLLEMQFRSQQLQYGAAYPDAVDHVIDLDGQVVGRCFVAITDDGVRVLDIAVLAPWRRRGIASRVLEDLGRTAPRGRVQLSVWADDTRARRFYEALGYSVRAQRPDGYLELCSTTTHALVPHAGGAR